MASNVYHEVVQVEVRDQSQAALSTVQKNVDKTEASLNAVSSKPWTITIKVLDMLTRPLMSMISSASSLAKKGLALPVTMVDRFTAPFRGMMGGLKEQGSQLVMGIGQGVGMTIFGLIMSGFGAVKDSIIGMNATLETSSLQFETLMGSADEAQAHVQDLFDFAKKTPFETQPVIDASRLLRTFGGAALDTMDNLTLFGNASAATSSDIKEVSFWFGRAYAAIQAGQPFGEATMRLQELAILSPQAAAKLEQLQKSGAKADVLWKAMTGDLSRFNGAMDKQAETWDGLTSTLSDAISLTSAKVFNPLFKVAKRAVGALNDVLSSDAFLAWADAFGKGIAGAVDNLFDFIGAVSDFGQAINEAFTGDPGAIGVVYDLIKKVFGRGVADFLNPFLNALMKFIPTLKEVGRWVSYAFQDLMRGDFKNVAKDLTIGFQQLTGIDASGFFNAVGDSLDWMINTAWPGFQKAMGDVMSFIVVEVVPKIGQLADWLMPIFSQAWAWWCEVAWPKIQEVMKVVADYISGTVLDQLQQLANKLSPIVAQAADAASGAIDRFNVSLGESNKPADQATKDYSGIGMVLQPMADIVSSVARAFAAFGPAVAATGEELGKLWALIGDGAIQGGIEGMKDSSAPLVVVLWALRFITGQLAVALEGWPATVRSIGPAFDDLGTTISNFINGAGKAMDDFLAGADAWAAGFQQAGRDIINGLIAGMASVDLAGWIGSHITNMIPDFVKNALGIHSPSTVMAEIGGNMMQGLLNGLSARLPDIMAFVGNLSNVFGGTDVGGWIDAAIRATGVPSSWAGPLSQIIQFESGGNPTAANLTDINAQNGDPSVGLMQLTGSNRARYTPAGMNPLDPIAQIIAGIRYIQDRYGDISNVPGVRSLASGGGYVPYDSGGVLPPGTTLAANNTGANEFVFTPGQLASLGGASVVFAPVFQIDATGAGSGVGDEISAAVEAQANQLFGLLGTQLRQVFGNLAPEAGAT